MCREKSVCRCMRLDDTRLKIRAVCGSMTKRVHTHTHTLYIHTPRIPATTIPACIHYTAGVAETYKRNRRIPKLLLNRFWANITRGGSGRFAMPDRVTAQVAKDEGRDQGRRGKGATWGSCGAGEGNGNRVVWGAERVRSRRRDRDRSRESSQALRQIS